MLETYITHSTHKWINLSLTGSIFQVFTTFELEMTIQSKPSISSESLKLLKDDPVDLELVIKIMDKLELGMLTSFQTYKSYFICYLYLSDHLDLKDLKHWRTKERRTDRKIWYPVRLPKSVMEISSEYVVFWNINITLNKMMKIQFFRRQPNLNQLL